MRNNRLAAVSECKRSQTARALSQRDLKMLSTAAGGREEDIIAEWQLRLRHVFWSSCGVIRHSPQRQELMFLHWQTVGACVQVPSQHSLSQRCPASFPTAQSLICRSCSTYQESMAQAWRLRASFLASWAPLTSGPSVCLSMTEFLSLALLISSSKHTCLHSLMSSCFFPSCSTLLRQKLAWLRVDPFVH